MYSRMVKRVLGIALLLLAGCGSPVYVRTGNIGQDGAARFDVDLVEAPGTGGWFFGSGGITADGTGGSEGLGGMGSGGSPEMGGSGASTGGASTGGTSTGGTSTGGASTGGVPATGGAGTGGAAHGGAGAGGMGTGGSGTGGMGTGGTQPDTARYSFESGTSAQGWAAAANTPAFASIARSTVVRFAGQASLAATMAASGPSMYQVAAVPNPAIPAGATVTFHVFVPSVSTVEAVQPYVLEGAPNYLWTGTYTPTSSLTVGAWNTITVKVPNPSGPIAGFGLKINLSAAWNGSVYLDSINW